MKVTDHEAAVVIAEIVQLLQQKGVDLSVLNLFEDYKDLENLIVNHDNHRWNIYRQEWVKEQ
jgi:hypothetical protein